MSDSREASILAQAAVRMQWGVKIPLRDGVRLNATLYLPVEHAVRAPAIFTLTPYIAQTYHDRALYFAAHGFPFLTIDVRGRGNSEGEFWPFKYEAEDAHDIIEWLARQPWCDGRVTMWGGSYGGYVQWAAAALGPIPLATIVPVAAPFLGVDFPGRSNFRLSYLMQWLTLVWGRTSQDRLFWNAERYWGEKYRQWFESGAPFKDLDTQLGCPSPIFQEWLEHPVQDGYWDRYNPSADQYAKIDCPVLTITGSYDGDQPGALMHYRKHLGSHGGSAEHYLVIGPWDHAGTRTPMRKFCGLEVGEASLVDLNQLHLEWYAWTMLGGSKPAFLKAKVTYYVMGADQWRYADSLDGLTARSVAYCLSSTSNPVDVFASGSLDEAPGTGGPDHWVCDPRDVSLAALESTVDPESRTDHRMIYASAGRHLVYHTAPSGQDIEVSGFFKLQVWLAIDQPDADFRVAVYDVGLDGAAVLLSTDFLRARYRESLREERLIATREPLCYDFERFTFVSRQIRKHHRLRLVIGPVHSIYSQKNYNSGGVVARESMADARTVTVRLFHDADHPSVLYVPVGKGK